MIFNYSLKYNKLIQLCKLNMFLCPFLNFKNKSMTDLNKKSPAISRRTFEI